MIITKSGRGNLRRLLNCGSFCCALRVHRRCNLWGKVWICQEALGRVRDMCAMCVRYSACGTLHVVQRVRHSAQYRGLVVGSFLFTHLKTQHVQIKTSNRQCGWLHRALWPPMSLRGEAMLVGEVISGKHPGLSCHGSTLMR